MKKRMPVNINTALSDELDDKLGDVYGKSTTSGADKRNRKMLLWMDNPFCPFCMRETILQIKDMELTAVLFNLLPRLNPNREMANKCTRTVLCCSRCARHIDKRRAAFSSMAYLHKNSVKQEDDVRLHPTHIIRTIARWIRRK